MTETSPAEIIGLYRYPVKGLSPEPLQRVVLGVGETFPADRRYAIENGPSGFDPAAPAWRAKTHYLMLMRNERLAAFRSHFDDGSHHLTIRKDAYKVGDPVPWNGAAWAASHDQSWSGDHSDHAGPTRVEAVNLWAHLLDHSPVERQNACGLRRRIGWTGM